MNANAVGRPTLAKTRTLLKVRRLESFCIVIGLVTKKVRQPLTECRFALILFQARLGQGLSPAKKIRAERKRRLNA
jgi:hypothetical protein